MRKYFPWLVAAFAVMASIAIAVNQSSTTKRVPIPASVPAPQLRQHPCSSSRWYMQCKALQSNLRIELPPTGRSGPLSAGAVFGIDSAWGGPYGGFAVAHGAHFACSYLSDSSKDWSWSRLHSYPAAGARACFVWETSQYRALGGYGAGFADARAASAELVRLGAAGADVEFAYDFDTTGRSCLSICSYLRGADAAIGKARVGVYGGLNTVRVTLNAGVASRAWQTLAWSFGTWDSRACIRQTSINNTWFGYSADYNYVVCANSGLWPASKPPPPPAPKKLCFHHQVTATQCARAKNRVARFHEEARVAAWRAWWVSDRLRRHSCRRPYRRHICRHLSTQGGNMAYNRGWLQRHITQTIRFN